LKEIRAISYYKRSVSHLYVTPDSKTLVSASAYERKVHITDLTTENEPRVIEKFGNTIPLSTVLMTHDGKSLIVGGARSGKDNESTKLFIVYDLLTGMLVRHLEELEDSIQTVINPALSPDDKVLAVADYEGGVQLWDIASGKKLQEWREIGYMKRLNFSPD